MKRKIIHIDESKCDGCGLCLPECPEGALRVIDGKARLISDLFCDGLGACLGHCPRGAIGVEEREAGAYQERPVMENIVRQGANVIQAHLAHLREHGQEVYLKEAMNFLKEENIAVPVETKARSGGKETDTAPCGCPGAQVKEWEGEEKAAIGPAVSRLRQWPVQLNLVPPGAPFLIHESDDS